MANPKKHDDEQRDLERALEQETRKDLLGDMEENRNLTGSTTWETLSEAPQDERAPSEPETQRASPSKKARDTEPNPPRTTTGPLTAPKFGSAGSGGAELEPGPERD